MYRLAEYMCLETHYVNQRVGNLNLLVKLKLNASLSSGETILCVNLNNLLVRTVPLVKYGLDVTWLHDVFNLVGGESKESELPAEATMCNI